MSSKRKLILFIHGLLGDEESWGAFKYLLTKHEREVFEHYDVDFFNYPSEVLQNPKIQTIAKSLRTHIENKYGDFDDIVLVCHSMGGLVAKKYLIDEVKIHRPSILKVKKVIFYDTPHNGADIANWAKVTTHKQVAQMATDSDFIEFVNTDFYALDIGKYLCMKYVIAEQKYRSIKVVSTQSAQAVWANRDTEVLIDKHHINCCKPEDIDEMSYRILKNFVLKDCPRLEIRSQPYLQSDTLKKQTALNRFNYKHDFIPFVGREREWAFLDSFCEADHAFLWTVIYEDGGTGKSRLAFEYVRDLIVKSNYAGFYTLDDGFSWEDWTPVADTFVVLDYAGSHPEEVGRMLSRLMQRSGIFEKKVRVLLLERQLNTPNHWYREKLLGGSGSTLEDSLHVEPYAIKALDNTSLVKIAHAFDEKIDSIDFIEKLERLDVKKRPLLAAILAENFDNNQNLVDKTTLIRIYLRRNKDKYWDGIESAYMLLASLLTVIEKADIQELNENVVNACCPIRIDIDKLTSLLGESESGWIYRGIEPDIIGELFVLELLGEHHDDRLFSELVDAETKSILLTWIWNKHPLRMVVFLERCMQDFLMHEGLLGIDTSRYIANDDNVALFLWSLHVVNLIGHMGEHDITKAETLFENLEHFAKTHPNNEEIAVEVAKASFNLINDMGEHDITKAETLFETLKYYLNKYPQNKIMRQIIEMLR